MIHLSLILSAPGHGHYSSCFTNEETNIERLNDIIMKEGRNCLGRKPRRGRDWIRDLAKEEFRNIMRGGRCLPLCIRSKWTINLPPLPIYQTYDCCSFIFTVVFAQRMGFNTQRGLKQTPGISIMTFKIQCLCFGS